MDINITTNGRTVHASFWENPKTKGALIVAPGIGVSRHFYRSFAGYYFNQGYSVLTFDYVSAAVGNYDHQYDDVRLCDWGRKDMATVIGFARRKFPNQNLFMVGHSIAGQLFPLAPNRNEISSACFVASQHASCENWEGKYRWIVAFFWHVVIPLSIRFAGHLPGYAYGGKYALHPSIAMDWAGWGKNQDGLVGNVAGARQAYEEVKVPVKFFSIEKDNILAPPKAVLQLAQQYGSTAKQHEHIRPQDYGLGAMGHFDFFKSRFSFLWPKVEDWFQKTI